MIKMGLLCILCDDGGRFLGGIDEGGFFSTSAERFQTKLTGSRKKIQNFSALNIKLNGAEKRLLNLGIRRTCCLSLQRVQYRAARRSCNNSHNFIPFYPCFHENIR